jgi:HAD superfamily hydrolase (TIGR01549 family)
MLAWSVRARAITFDAGQTLVELDSAMLARRLAERGVAAQDTALEAALPSAWRKHEQAVAAGARHPWKVLMAGILAGTGGEHLVDWLWDEQPRANLWRRPVPGMRELVADLHTSGVPMAVISNSEGKLAALLEELGWAPWFAAIADSGALGVAKPDRGIFTWTLERLGVPPEAAIHVGDSREADVEGALAAGMRAVWFGPFARDLDDPRVAICPDASSLRRTLAEWM